MFNRETLKENTTPETYVYKDSNIKIDLREIRVRGCGLNSGGGHL